MKALRNLVVSVGLAVFAAGCNPVDALQAAEAKPAASTTLHPDVAPGSGDGAVYEYH
jgi:hypothetical protein